MKEINELNEEGKSNSEVQSKTETKRMKGKKWKKINT